ncbi:hypothetical protein QBC43DRAFT_323879 [Cladorrhinum sp. PSN259]|nr:hypothetical protein QBC43DRAFT_323879 [Cladorrhinum sp. PSN259]
MSKILAVFGATGQQGGGLITHVLNDPELSKSYKIRAITRDVNSGKAKQLAEKVQVVQGDISDRSSLETALTGAHTVFIMTAPAFGPDGFETEYNSAKTMADVAVERGVQYIIFSTLPPVKEISGGKYTKVSAFDAKAAAEKYIRTLPVRSAFYCPGSFMENFQNPWATLRRKGADGSWIFARHDSPQTPFPFIAVVADTGKFVGAILADPEKYEGKRFDAASEIYTWEEACAIMSRVIGHKIVYEQVSVEEYRSTLPPLAADGFIELFSYFQDFGYFGPDMDKSVAWAKENTRGKLTTLEEYLRANPIKFE